MLQAIGRRYEEMRSAETTRPISKATLGSHLSWGLWEQAGSSDSKDDTKSYLILKRINFLFFWQLLNNRKFPRV